MGAFNGLVRTPVVKDGQDYLIPKGGHRFQQVYSVMMLQIARDYNGLPDVRTLKARQIRFFYEGMRNELKRHTAPKK